MLKKSQEYSRCGQTLGEIDKVFETVSAPQKMVACGHHVWIALPNGAEVRNARTAEPVHGWDITLSNEKGDSSIWSILSVMTQNKGLQVWMGLSNGSIEVYDAQSFRLVQRLAKHAGGVYCLAEFGGYVYSGSSDFKVAQWYAEDGRLVRMLHGHTNYVRCLYAEGSAVVSGSDDCTVRVWDVGSGEQQLTGHFHGRAGVSALCRVGVTMWSGDDDGRVIAWKLGTCEALRVLQAHGGRVASLRKIGSRVYSGGADGVIAVFDADDGRLVQQVEGQRGTRITALVGPSELQRFCIWSCGTDGIVRCWYQDEYVSMTGDQETFAEDFWYRTGSTPYREFRESVVKQSDILREKLTMAEDQNSRLLDLVSFSNASLTPEHMQRREAKLKEENRVAKERQVMVENELQKSKELLQRRERETNTLVELLRVAQAELKTLDPSALLEIQGSTTNLASGAEPNIPLPSQAVGGTSFISGLAPQSGVGAGTPQLYSAGTQPLGTTAGVGAGTPQPYSAGTQPLGTTAGVGAGTPQLYSAGTQPLGTTAGVGAGTPQPYSAGTQPLGTTAGVGAGTPQPYSAGTQPLGTTAGVGAGTPQPYSAGTQPLGTTAGVGAGTPQPYSAGTQPPGTTAGVGAGTPQLYSAGTQPLGTTAGVGAGTPQPYSAGTQPLGTTAGVGAGTPQLYSAGTQPLGTTAGVGAGTPQPYSAGTQPPGTTAGVGAGTPQLYSAGTQPPGTTAGVGAGTPQLYSAGTQPPGTTAGVGAGTPQPYSAGTSAQTGNVILDVLARNAAAGSVGLGGLVEWTNKNVGHYIERRYYGAEPSLRAPALEKRRLRPRRLPEVKIEPRKVKKEGGKTL
ncbi:WD40 repeat [Trypanosoma melophagium]|uniref:WD40 repeat n=1 Tax=Trypanosoma melophagium TaxID=715481 RepID=UPI00351A8C5A|nr:WD40 repeat [Trypanosoma melophagium]